MSLAAILGEPSIAAQVGITEEASADEKQQAEEHKNAANAAFKGSVSRHSRCVVSARTSY